MENNSLNNNEVNNGEVKKQGLFSKVMVEVANQCVIIAVSLILLIIFDEGLKLVGYYISARIPTFFLVYLILNIAYRPVLECSKLKATIGNKLFK